jgi:hypothetical protein
MEEASMKRTILLVAVAVTTAGCGPRRLNVVQTTQQTLIAVGYSADRSQSIFRADDEAQEYCERRRQGVVFIKQDTVYQGRYNQDVTEAGRVAGRVAGGTGQPQGCAGEPRALVANRLQNHIRISVQVNASFTPPRTES